MNDEVKIVNEFDRDGHHFKIGVSADGQVSIYLDNGTKAHHGYHFPGMIQIPKGLEIDGKIILQPCYYTKTLFKHFTYLYCFLPLQ